jgi:flagellar basal body P-ring formation protein FlgA
VQRDQSVTLIYETAGLYLTMRGKALDGGTEGDVVNVLNLQSKRTVSGIVTGRGQVSVAVAAPRPPAAEPSPSISSNETETPVPVAVAAGSNSQVTPTE